MKFHKIRGIDKNICTCEQKIAYNYASADYQWIMRSNIELWEYLDSVTKRIQENKKIMARYDIDAIIHCLRTGIIDYCKYCKTHSGILTSYKEIGKMFPSLYPIK